MEQYIMRLPDRLRDRLKEKIEQDDLVDVECIAGADPTEFKFKMEGHLYPATMINLPCIVESHKTFDDMMFFKSGDIAQMLIVFETEGEQKKAQKEGLNMDGLSPPTTNIVKRKYEKTKKRTPFPKEEVARVEEDLVKFMQGGVVEDIQEELVQFEDWMVDPDHPNGIVIMDEMEFMRRNPKYLDVKITTTPIKINDRPTDKQA